MAKQLLIAGMYWENKQAVVETPDRGGRSAANEVRPQGRCRARWATAPMQERIGKTKMTANMQEIKITPRDQDVLKLLVQGCSNKEIAAQLKISPRTVKQHLRTLFLRAGIRDGRKRVKLATAMFQKEQRQTCHHVTD